MAALPSAIPRPGADGSAAIRLDGVTKRYGSFKSGVSALERVDLAIDAGEFLSVVGPSGCGKSTLMRLIARLTPATDGAITIFGDTSRQPSQDMGIVFQQAVLLPWRSVLENVLFPADMTGRSKGLLRDRALDLLETVGLKDFAQRYPHELSGGMKQRASIARSLLLEPKLLLMDEPFGALDALTREQMRLDLEALWLKQRMTIVFITHSIDEAVLLADRVVVMSPRPGRVEHVFEIAMPRPRGLDARRHPAFIETSEAITDIFLSRGVLQSGGAGARG